MSGFEKWLPDVNARPEEWIAPIVRSGNAELALDLINKKPELLNHRAGGNNSLLQEAAYFGHQELADSLQRLGAKLDLFSAVALGRNKAVRVMLANNPNLLRKCSAGGIGLLPIASRSAVTELVPLLLSLGADVNDSRNKKRYTPLFFASVSNAELLLLEGAYINARAKHGFTALHYAAKKGDAEMTKFLVNHGARTDLQTEGRQTAWALAVRLRQKDIAAFLWHQS
jgi:ankyrin repeat protein